MSPPDLSIAENRVQFIADCLRTENFPENMQQGMALFVINVYTSPSFQTVLKQYSSAESFEQQTGMKDAAETARQHGRPFTSGWTVLLIYPGGHDARHFSSNA